MEQEIIRPNKDMIDQQEEQKIEINSEPQSSLNYFDDFLNCQKLIDVYDQPQSSQFLFDKEPYQNIIMSYCVVDICSKLKPFTQINLSPNFQPENEQENKEKRKSERNHLKRPRKKKGEKSLLQKTVKGYWNKNFLQFGKRVHIEYIIINLGVKFFTQNPTIQQIKEKKGIRMNDYLTLYRHRDLRQLWKDFFSKKILYRELMLSRVQTKFRPIFAKFIYRYEEAFIQNEFDHI